MTNQHPITPPPPVVEGPTDEELAALMSARFLVNQSASARAIANIGTDEQVAQVRAILDGEAIAYARAVLARWGTPTPQPVVGDAPLSSVTNCHISGPAPKPFASWSDYFNHVQQSGVISGLKIQATLPTPSNGDD